MNLGFRILVFGTQWVSASQNSTQQVFFLNIHITQPLIARWWFQFFLSFTPIWGRFPIWFIFLRWVETTNHSLPLVSKGPGNPTSFLCGCASHATCGTYLGRSRTCWKGAVPSAGASVTPTYQKCWCETFSPTKGLYESMSLWLW